MVNQCTQSGGREPAKTASVRGTGEAKCRVSHRRGGRAEQRSRLREKGWRLFERSEFEPDPAGCEQRKVPRSGPDVGSPFLWLLSFGEAIESSSPVGAKSSQRQQPKHNQRPATTTN